ncbi:MAG TPA: MaoC/PaaZ C-terminal domain-containing protein [Sporichthyaceae bacterium]|jgi:acyl dehydratase|nr:MaoC/PaaZ C-terminal domain-containing protein [Sporichthyaceae bacterium]
MGEARSSDELLYGEDFRPGMEFAFSSVTLTEDDMISFARQWDPQSFHIDPAAAAESPWGGIIASGIQTIGVYQRLVVEALWSRAAVKAGKALTANLRRPVRPGTTLTGKVVVRTVTHRPQRGDSIVSVAAELVDDSGAVVLELTLDGVLLLRGGPGPS